ncbi:MAG: DUF1631 family protein, partial [Burkholderiaceae bacterium]
PSLQDCLEAVLEQSHPLIDGVLDGLRIAIEKRQVRMPAEAAAVIEQMARQRAAVRESFAGHLRQAIYGGGGPDMYSQPLVKFDELNLLEESQLDENIEVARALQEVARSVDDVLPLLDALMSTLVGWVTIHSQINPLRPELFVRALRETVADYAEELDVRGAVIGPAAGRLGVGLQRTYREVADWLRSHGVEPASVTQPVVTPEAAAKQGSAGSSVARTLLTLDRLRKLLSGELDGDTPRPPPDFLHTVPASVETLQDMKQVEAMVQRLTKKAKDNPGAAKEAADRRKARSRGADGKELGKELGEEVARLMLENLIDDDRILPKVRDLLQSLEPVLLRLTKADARFFSNKKHPARVFLDRVIQRSQAFSTEQDEGFHRFLKMVQEAIDELSRQAAEEGEASPLFTQAISRLEEVWEKEDAAQRQRREEAARALLHAEQRNLLAQRLAQEFRLMADDAQEISRPVVDFLCGPWAQAVAESQLSHADGTADPDGFHALVDDLLWSVQPRVAKRNRGRLVVLIPEMLGKIRKGLQLIGFPPERIQVLFDALIAIHEAALEEGRPAGQAVVEEEQESVLSQDAPAEQVWLAESEVNEAGYLDEDSVMPLDLSGPEEGPAVGGEAAAEAAEPAASPVPAAPGELDVGNWVELMLEGQWVRAQLTWRSPHRTLFMFISGAGSAHSMSRRTLDRLRTQGLIRLVSTGHEVDNALDAVAQEALRNTIGKGA